MLGWIYVILFLLQLFWLVRTCRIHRKIGVVLICNLLSVILSLFLLWYFDTLPGFGMIPGFAYFPEVFYSLCAAVIFTVLTLVTFFCWLYRRKK